MALGLGLEAALVPLSMVLRAVISLEELFSNGSGGGMWRGRGRDGTEQVEEERIGPVQENRPCNYPPVIVSTSSYR